MESNYQRAGESARASRYSEYRRCSVTQRGSGGCFATSSFILPALGGRGTINGYMKRASPENAVRWEGGEKVQMRTEAGWNG